MTTKVQGKSVPVGRGWCAAVLATLLGALAACGGGDQVERFTPNRLTALGDENSLIEADGRKYTANGFDTAVPPALDCTVNPIWIQYVAGLWGIRFAQCAAGAASTAGRIFAANGAKVADLAAQIAAAGTLGEKDIVTVYVGTNDLLDIYTQFTGANEPALIALAQNAGTALATQIYNITQTGAKVVFLTVPELGLTPYARAQEQIGAGRAALLTRLTVAFNTKLRTGVSGSNSPTFIDGHQGVQVLADDLIRSLVTQAGTTTTAFVNVSDGICDGALAATLLACTTNTLLTTTSTPVLTAGGTAGNYLWADATHLSPGGHASLGTTAANRINANPL